MISLISLCITALALANALAGTLGGAHLPLVTHCAVDPTVAMFAFTNTQQASAVVWASAIVGALLYATASPNPRFVAQARAVNALAVLAAVFGTKFERACFTSVSLVALAVLFAVATPTAVAVVFASHPLTRLAVETFVAPASTVLAASTVATALDVLLVGVQNQRQGLGVGGLLPKLSPVERALEVLAVPGLTVAKPVGALPGLTHAAGVDALATTETVVMAAGGLAPYAGPLALALAHELLAASAVPAAFKGACARRAVLASEMHVARAPAVRAAAAVATAVRWAQPGVAGYSLPARVAFALC